MTSSIWAPGTNPFPLGVRLGLPGGADLVAITPFLDVVGPTVQDALEELKADIEEQPLDLSVTNAKVATNAGIEATKLSFSSSAAGALARTVQSKLQATLIDRSDFTLLANYTAATVASPNSPTLDAAGNYGAKLTPTGESAQLDLKNAVLTVSAGPRDAVVYRNATSVNIYRKFATMGGFRFRGQYTKGRAPVFPMPASTEATCSPSGLGAETVFRTENWYAAFACANSGDAAAVIKTMPFLRVASVAGNIVTLNRAGEAIHTVSAQTYAWTAANNLVGVECLIISEGGGWSGRTTTITANTSGTITLASVGSLAFGDFLLPAPPNKTYFVYLASWYMDTAEVRNIYDTGSVVKAKMIFITTPNVATGSFPAPGQVMNGAGYICPLATGLVIDSIASLSTASVGAVAEYFDPDGANHIVDTRYITKNSAGSETYVFSNIEIPFLYPQTFNYYNAGALAATRTSGQLNITGWFEP